MSCDQYKTAITEAAAMPNDSAPPDGPRSGRLLSRAPLQHHDVANAALLEHLAACTSCREFYTSEQNLFAAIDAGLSSVVNADPTPSFVPRVRAAIELETGSASRSWFVLWPVAATMIAVCLVVVIFQRFHSQPQVAPQVTASVSGTNSATTSTTKPQTGSATSEIASEPKVWPQPSLQLAPPQAFRHDARKTPLVPPSVESAANHAGGSQKLEVLVPLDERIALANFMARLPQRGEIAVALTKSSRDRPSLELASAPLEIAELKVEPLSPAETR